VYLKLIATSIPYISDVCYRFRIPCMLMWNFRPLSLSVSLNTHWPFMEWLVWYFLLPCLLSLISTTMSVPNFQIFFCTQSIVFCLHNWQQSVVVCVSDWYSFWIVVMELGIWCMLQLMPLSVPVYFSWIVACRALVMLRHFLSAPSAL